MSQYFKLLTNEQFEQINTFNESLNKDKFNYCPDCDVPMEITNSEYQCMSCGLISSIDIDPNIDHDDMVNKNIKMTSGRNSGKYYNLYNNYPKLQLKNIEHQLFEYNKGTEHPIARDILMKAAANYNALQKTVIEDIDGGDGNGKQKKFVRRGNIKNEILAALVYFECIKAQAVRSRNSIITFMKLDGGFSRGELILRELSKKGYLEIPDQEPIADYVERYAEALNITDENYKAFVYDIVKLSESAHVGMSSNISSKIAGAFWLLIQRMELSITAADLEKAADGTKKTTFMKFFNAVQNHMNIFSRVFKEHNVPLGNLIKI